jgi:hypothetical protein
LKGTSLALLVCTGRQTWEPHALVIANCKILMCYSMLGISQQLLFASIMRPHYTVLDWVLFLHPSTGFLSDWLPKQGIA